MKNSKGISVLVLVITVIVMIIITSITVYNGISVISDARKKDATDKLSTIASSLRKDDSFLSFTSGETIFTEQDFIALDLKEYYDTDYPIHLKKDFLLDRNQKVVTYMLTMYDGEEMTEVYATQEFSIEKMLEKNVYVPMFDELNGVNTPILFDRMYAMKIDESALVEDVYEDTWYNYNASAPSFAKMKYDTNGNGKIEDETVTYAWIPRFAYSIQNYYNGINDPNRPHTEVPNTAIKIVFLRENTNYMTNYETLPTGYRVHPAFSSAGTEKPGIWVAIEASETEATFQSAVSGTQSIVGSHESLSSHLMTNSEFSAALYLMFAFNCLEEIDFAQYDEFVAAGSVNNFTLRSLEYADLYERDDHSDTGVVDKYGDAMTETNWDRIDGVFPVNSTDIVVRLLKSSFFNFDSVTSTSRNHYRPVIVTK